MRISLRVISAVGLHVIGGIMAHDANSTPCDFCRPIARFNLDRPIARFNPDRLISLFMSRRHPCGLGWPAMCLHHAMSPPWVLHD